MTTEVNTDELSLEQLRQLAVDDTRPLPVDQPRDDKGRFVATEDAPPVDAPPTDPPADDPPADDPPAAPPAAPVTFEESIDLGDGSGVQVFRANSESELRRKLVDAQTNATRKIREQTKRIKELEEAVRPKRSAEDKFLLQQRMLTDPDEVVQELVTQQLTAAEQRRQDGQRAAQQKAAEANRVIDSWEKSQTDFHASEENAKRIGTYIRRFLNGEMTTENLDSAYSALKADGLLQNKPATNPPAAAAPTRRASSLSTRSTAVPTPPPAEDPNTMPLDKLRELARNAKW